MIGLEIKIAGKTKADLLILLKEVLEEVENGSTSMYIPMNDPNDCEASFSISKIGTLDVFDDWNDCISIERDFLK